MKIQGSKIVIVDYGLGNLMSLKYKFKKIGIDAAVSSEKECIMNAGKLILPGVGHFAKGMENLRNYDLIGVLNKKVLEEKTPVLGICLGMQLFTKRSEEGFADGLGWIDAETKKFCLKGLKIPHMGWNTIEIKKKGPVFNGIENGSKFYFLHSYHVCPGEDCATTTTGYGHEFVSSVQKGNIFGVQFHPEKSHKNGIKLIKNFAEVV
jgi:glutamine amidotransferase